MEQLLQKEWVMENQEFWLEVIKGKSRGQTFRLLSDVITVGRRLTAKERKINWLLLDEPSLSRIHALLQWNNEIQSFELFHKSSARPTLVNNKKIDHVPLSSQDRIQMGDVVFRFWEGPIEKKFDYYLDEEVHEEVASTPPVKQSFTPLDLQREYQQKVNSQADSEETYNRESTETAMLQEAAAREERKIVKAGEREVQKVQEFKPLVFTQFSELEREEAATREKVFYNQKEQKSDAADFTPLKFSGEKPSPALPERESPLRKTSKVEQYLNGRGEKTSPSTIKPVNLIKDISASPPPQKGGKVLGASEERGETAVSFTPLAFPREEKRETFDDPRVTRLLSNKHSSGSSDDTPAPFKPVSLIQSRAAIDTQSSKGRGKILGSQNKEEEDAEAGELSDQTSSEFRNGASAYLSSAGMSEETSRHIAEENEKDIKHSSVKTFNLLKPEAPKITSQSYGEGTPGSPVENLEEQFPSLIHDEALNGNGPLAEDLGEISLPPLNETKKENEQPSPVYRPQRIRSKTPVRYSGWNKELSSREKNANKAGGESEAKPAEPAEQESPAEITAGIPSHQEEEPRSNETEMENESTTLTPPLDLVDYNKGSVPAEEARIPEEQSDGSFEILTEASLQPTLELDEGPPARLLSPRKPQHPEEGEPVQQMPTGSMLQPYLVPADTPISNLQSSKQLFRSKAPLPQETSEQEVQIPSRPFMETLQEPLESPTLFSSGRVQQPMESPTLFSSERVQQPMESPTLFSSERVQQPMESPTLFSSGRVQQPMESPTMFSYEGLQQPGELPMKLSSETVEHNWTPPVPERVKQPPLSPPEQPWTPPVPERVKQPLQPPDQFSLEMPELPWAPTAPVRAQEPLQPSPQFSSELSESPWTPLAPENTQDQLQPPLLLSLEMPDLSWTPQASEIAQQPLQPPLQLPVGASPSSNGKPPRLLSDKKDKDPITGKKEQMNILLAPWDKEAHAEERTKSTQGERAVLPSSHKKRTTEKTTPSREQRQTPADQGRAEIISTEEAAEKSNGYHSKVGRLRAPWEKILAKKREKASKNKSDDIPPPPPSLNKPAAIFNRRPDKESMNAPMESMEDKPRTTRFLNSNEKSPEQTDAAGKVASQQKSESGLPKRPERSVVTPQISKAIPSHGVTRKNGPAQKEEPVPPQKTERSTVPPLGPELAPPWEIGRPIAASGEIEPVPPWETGRPPITPQGIEPVLPQGAVHTPPARQGAEHALPFIGRTTVSPHTGVGAEALKSKESPVNSHPPTGDHHGKPGQKTERAAGSMLPLIDEPTPKSNTLQTRKANGERTPQENQPRDDFNPYHIAPTDVMDFLLDDEGKKSDGSIKPSDAITSHNVPYDSFKSRMNRQMEERRVQEKIIPSQTEQDEIENNAADIKDDGRPLFHSWKPPQGPQADETLPTPPEKVKVTPSPTSPQMKKAVQNEFQTDLWEILLIQSSDEEEGKYYPINKSSITIGKSEESDIVVHDTQLAPVHLKIYCEGTTFFLQKMERTQPVFINGKILATSAGKVILDGDLIQISGKTKLVFKKKRT